MKCKQGHPLGGENIYTHPKSGKRRCRACQYKRFDKWQKANREILNRRTREKYISKPRKIHCRRKHLLEFKKQKCNECLILTEKRKQANKLKRLERRRKETKHWKQTNKSKVKAQKRRREALKLGQMGWLPDNYEDLLWNLQEGLCAYCKGYLTEYHLEHMIPLCRAGLHDWENVCLACPECNMKKGTMTVKEYLAA